MKKIMLVFLICGLLNTLIANAEVQYAWQVDGSLLKNDELLSSESICWIYSHDVFPNNVEKIRIINLNGGKMKDYSLDSGYIIQKSHNDYEGVLFASESNGIMRIYHVNGNQNPEIVFEVGHLPVFWNKGDQTVRAYMNEYLYYIKALDNPEQGTQKIGKEVYSVSNQVRGQFCRVNKNGEEYNYQLKSESNNVSDQLWNRLIDGYALHENGTLAWVENTYGENETSLVKVEIPGEGCREIINMPRIKDAGYDRISEEGLCWITDVDLLFLAESSEIKGNVLLTINIQSGEIKEYCNKSGEKIVIGDIGEGSGLYMNAERNCIAYFADPNGLFKTQSDGINLAVPKVLSLLSGQSYYVCEYKNKDNELGMFNEYRRSVGQLSWLGK